MTVIGKAPPFFEYFANVRVGGAFPVNGIDFFKSQSHILTEERAPGKKWTRIGWDTRFVHFLGGEQGKVRRPSGGWCVGSEKSGEIYCASHFLENFIARHKTLIGCREDTSCNQILVVRNWFHVLWSSFLKIYQWRFSFFSSSAVAFLIPYFPPLLSLLFVADQNIQFLSAGAFLIPYFTNLALACPVSDWNTSI